MNAVAFADESSHVFFTGSDDRRIKVWDRRMITDAKPNAVGYASLSCDASVETERRVFRSFLGHREGITHLDSKVAFPFIAPCACMLIPAGGWPVPYQPVKR